MALQLFGLAKLGRDCEVRYLADNTPVVNLSLAFNYGRKGTDGRRPTQWVDGALFGKLAEALAPYLLKGTSVAVTIEDAHIESFQKADGTPATKLAGRVTAIDLAGGGEQRATAPPPVPAPPPARRPAAAPAHSFEDMDSDIPF